MKIALVRRRFSATGGAELYLQRLLGALLGAGHESHLYTEAWDGAPEGLVIHPVACHAARAKRLPAFAAAVDAQLRNERFDCVFSLERTLRQDVYRAGDGLHRVWLRQRRRFAPWYRKPFTAAGAFHRNLRALEQCTFDPTNTGHIIVNSEMVRGEILEHFDFPESRIHLVRNGIDLARIRGGRRKETRTRFGFHDEEFVLLFVGSGWERKGLPFFLRAFRRLSPTNVRALIVGKGRKPLFTPDGAVFAGAMSAVEDAYAAADLLVLPPIYEPSSNVVAEALAVDLPVVTTRFNGAAELIREGRTGSVVSDPADTGQLVHSIERWHAKRGLTETTPDHELSLERNLSETLEILELAAAEKKR